MTKINRFLSTLLLLAINLATANDASSTLYGTWHASKADAGCTGPNTNNLDRDVLGLGDVSLVLNFFRKSEINPQDTYNFFLTQSFVGAEEVTKYSGVRSVLNQSRDSKGFVNATLKLEASKYSHKAISSEDYTKEEINATYTQRISLMGNDTLYVFGNHIFQVKEHVYLRLCDEGQTAFIKFKRAPSFIK